MHYACALGVAYERKGLVGTSFVLCIQSVHDICDALTAAGDDGAAGWVLNRLVSM